MDRVKTGEIAGAASRQSAWKSALQLSAEPAAECHAATAEGQIWTGQQNQLQGPEAVEKLVGEPIFSDRIGSPAEKWKSYSLCHLASWLFNLMTYEQIVFSYIPMWNLQGW